MQTSPPSQSKTCSGDDRPPDWVPDEDVLGRNTDRQVLVVGGTVAGLVLALLLERAGYDPLLVAGPERSAPSRLAYLWPPALRVLDAIGAGTRVLDHSVVDSVSVRSQDGETAVRSRDRDAMAAPPVFVRTATLSRLLRARLSDGPERRFVDGLSRRDDGLVVEFDDGVREWFDAVVDAGGATATLRPGRRGRDATTLLQYEAPVDGAAVPNRLRERWTSDALVQCLPRPDGDGSLLRATAPAADSAATSAVGGSQAGDVTDHVGDVTDHAGSTSGLPDELAGVEPNRVPQAGLSADPDPGRWGDGRVASCGGAAWPLAPASGARVSLGVEDALAFVSQLARGPRSTADAVAAYATRRVARVGDFRRRATAVRTDHDCSGPGSHPSWLAALGTLRTVALGPLLGGEAAALQRDGFG